MVTLKEIEQQVEIAKNLPILADIKNIIILYIEQNIPLYRKLTNLLYENYTYEIMNTQFALSLLNDKNAIINHIIELFINYHEIGINYHEMDINSHIHAIIIRVIIHIFGFIGPTDQYLKIRDTMILACKEYPYDT